MARTLHQGGNWGRDPVRAVVPVRPGAIKAVPLLSLRLRDEFACASGPSQGDSQVLWLC